MCNFTTFQEIITEHQQNNCLTNQRTVRLTDKPTDGHEGLRKVTSNETLYLESSEGHFHGGLVLNPVDVGGNG